MTRVIINGACGRMGGRLVDLVVEDPELKLVGALEKSDDPRLGSDIGTVHGKGEIGVVLSDEMAPDADVLIDFSTPESTVLRAKQCAENEIALVIGTTGLTPEQKKAVEGAAESVPCLMAPNMSLGANLLFDLAAQVARALGEEYDVEIVEVHHRFKKDAPSGTATRILERIADATGRSAHKDAIYGRHGQVGERTRTEIGVHAVRSGDVVGDHIVIFGTLGERIELVHRAHTRDAFAKGALRATKFVVQKPPGMYSFSDVLSFV